MGLEKFFEADFKEVAFNVARAMMFLKEREYVPRKSELSDVVDTYFLNRIEAVENRIEVRTEILLELLWLLAESMKGE